MDKTNPEKRKTLRKTIELRRTGQKRRGSELRAHLSRTKRTKRRAVKGPGKTLPTHSLPEGGNFPGGMETGKRAFQTMLKR